MSDGSAFLSFSGSGALRCLSLPHSSGDSSTRVCFRDAQHGLSDACRLRDFKSDLCFAYSSRFLSREPGQDLYSSPGKAGAGGTHTATAFTGENEPRSAGVFASQKEKVCLVVFPVYPSFMKSELSCCPSFPRGACFPVNTVQTPWTPSTRLSGRRKSVRGGSPTLTQQPRFCARRYSNQ